jgi:hypothetical protein
VKRVNRKEYERLMALSQRLSEAIADPSVQSERVWRGDVRAIQWAAWWVRETIEDEQRKG